MPTIQSLRERRDKCSFPWGERDTIELEYRTIPAADITEADFTALVKECDGLPAEEQRRKLAGFLVPVLGAWNVYEWETRDPETGTVTEHGPMQPITVEDLAAFDDRFIATCITSILEHVYTGKVTGLPLNALGTAITSPTAVAASSPATKENRASRRNAKSPKSPSSAASRRGNSRTIPSGSPSSARG